LGRSDAYPSPLRPAIAGPIATAIVFAENLPDVCQHICLASVPIFTPETGDADFPIFFRNRGWSISLQPMPRYHFDLVASEEVTDVTGATLDNDDQAERVALSLATDVREAKPEFIGKGYEIVVRTEEGNEIFRVSIDHVPRLKNGP
jgi:hypothetical protein